MAEHLKPEHQRFIREFVKHQNGTKAVIDAGYSKNGAAVTANRLLKNPKIKAEIDKILQGMKQNVVKQTRISQAWVIRKLKREARERGEGSSHSARVRAVELIGKHIGMWPHKVVMSGDQNNPVKVQQSGEVKHTHTVDPEALTAFTQDMLAAGLAYISEDGGIESLDTPPTTP